MNIKPEQIPDEVVEAAMSGYETSPVFDDAMRHALAAALPVLLEKVAWIYPLELKLLRNNNDNVVAGCLDTTPPPEAIYLYTLPTPETPNAHP